MYLSFRVFQIVLNYWYIVCFYKLRIYQCPKHWFPRILILAYLYDYVIGRCLFQPSRGSTRNWASPSKHWHKPLHWTQGIVCLHRLLLHSFKFDFTKSIIFVTWWSDLMTIKLKLLNRKKLMPQRISAPQWAHFKRTWFFYVW